MHLVALKSCSFNSLPAIHCSSSSRREVATAAIMERLSSVLLLLMFFAPLAFGQLQLGFYNSTCPRAESIVKEVVTDHFNKDADSPAAALLRMFFHDCFDGGCDATVLSFNENGDARIKRPHPSSSFTHGFELINDIKEKLEAECPSVVSCADIIALATRDAVASAGGLTYNVPTGRRDSLGGPPSRPIDELPAANILVSDSLKLFHSKGFNREEMVTLLGAHTVGVTRCGQIFDMDRGKLPIGDEGMFTKINGSCTDGFELFPLDHTTPKVVDNVYYKNILANDAVLFIDQALGSDDFTKGIVKGFASDGNSFLRKFAAALVKLGNLDVLVGDEGEVRTKCYEFNKPTTAK